MIRELDNNLSKYKTMFIRFWNEIFLILLVNSMVVLLSIIITKKSCFNNIDYLITNNMHKILSPEKNLEYQL